MYHSVECRKCGAVLSGEGSPCPRCLLATGLELKDDRALGPGFLDDLPLTGKAMVIADKYQVQATLGRGGMGVVYKAWQGILERTVAVKMISTGVHASMEAKARFLQEAKLAGGLQHPNIVAVYDWGEDEGVPFFSMEFIRGRDLASVVRAEGPLEPRRAAQLVKAVAEAVAYAHEQQILHRDLKPQNLLLDQEGRVKITDFGLARRLDVPAEFTGSGQVLGTAGYMAPEQVEGGKQPVGVAVDVYGLGAVIYHLLTGRAPFAGGELAAVLEQVRHEEPLPLRRLNASVPVDLETICLKCLEKEPRRRYENAHAVAEELVRFLEGEPIVARPVNRVEKTWRWCRRNPVVAGLSGLTILAFLLGFTGTYGQWKMAEANAHRAEASAASEAQQRKLVIAATTETTNVLNRTRVQLSEVQYELGNEPLQLAQLAEALRQQPDHDIARQRLILALSQRNYLWPVCPALEHFSSVTQSQFSPDGARLLTVESSLVRLWDTASGESVGVPIHHPGEGLRALFSPDGTRILTIATDGPAVLSDGFSGQRIYELKEGLSGNKSPLLNGVNAVMNQLGVSAMNEAVNAWDALFSPDGRQVAVASRDHAVRLLELGSKPKLLFQFDHPASVLKLWFTPEGKELITLTTEGDLRFWDVKQGKICDSTANLGFQPRLVEMSPDRKVLAATATNDLHLWSLPALQSIGPVITNMGLIKLIRFNPDGRRLAVAGSPNHKSGEDLVWLWDIPSHQALAELFIHKAAVTALAFSPHGLILAAGTEDGTVRLWDGLDGQPLSMPAMHASPVTHLAFSPDSRLLCAGTEIRLAHLWHVHLGRPVSELGYLGRGLSSLQFNASGNLILTAGMDNKVRLWDWQQGTYRSAPFSPSNSLVSACSSPNGKAVAMVSATGQIALWDGASSQISGNALVGPINRRWPLQFSPDGRWLMVVSQNRMHFFKPEPGLPLAWTDELTNPIWTAAFSPNSQWVLAGVAYGELGGWVWDTRAGNRRYSWKMPLETLSNRVSQVKGVFANTLNAYIPEAKSINDFLARQIAPVAVQLASVELPAAPWAGFSPDNRYLVTASDDGALQIRDAITGTVLRSMVGHRAAVLHGAFSPESTLLATASLDETFRIWEIPSGRLITVLREQRGMGTVVRFSPDGKRIVTLSSGGPARVWDSSTGILLSDKLNLARGIDAVFSPDSQSLATIAREPYLRCWDLTVPSGSVPPALLDLAEALAGIHSLPGFIEAVGANDLYLACQTLSASKTTNAYSAWTRWLLDRSETNTISFSSRITRRQQVERLIAWDELPTLKRAVLMDPTNAVALARLARASLRSESVKGSYQYNAAAHYLRCALQFGREQPEVQQIRDALAKQGILPSAVVGNNRDS